MSWVAGFVLVAIGLAGLMATSNAARPLIDPTRRYSSWWLPAMVVAELAPLWLVMHAVVLAVGLAAGAHQRWVGRVGVVVLVLSMVLLVWIIVRSSIGVRRLRRLVRGRVHPARGRARVVGRPISTPPGVTEQHGIEWRDGLTLDLIRPDAADRRRPVLVYVHGGGWTGGDPQRQARDLYHALALDGWATLSVRYPFTPHVDVEDQIDTIKTAIRWARTDLAGHGVEQTHLVVAGGSAGGHLAAMAALTASDEHERVDACVGIYGVYDMANRNQTRAYWAKTKREVMLASVDEAPERYRAVSPLDHISDRSPPMLIVHGTHDTLVPVGEGEQFVAALRAAGRPVDFVPVYGAQHAFDAVSSITSRTAAAVIRTWLRDNVLEGVEQVPGQAPTA
ncbi:MAG TPA: alpha/beta hydrolase [Ilumatobacter sp.]|nr:alpha/beta hydrolase [Ilumatobacter sp.]